MSQLREALKRKIKKQQEWSNLTPAGRKELEEMLTKEVKEGRQKVNERAQFFRKR